ncbi:hypothetical protein, partial [Phytoactinopolyspora endophytica]|uniref:hypothetical protein n=1 Tax=Phytoactinopolyspora endophytica TaxID=1642495 RepID=UPI00197C2B56
LTYLSHELDADTFRIAEFIAQRARESWTLNEQLIRHIIAPPVGYCPPNPGACYDKYGNGNRL